MRACAIVPAFDAARTVGDVVRGLREVGLAREAIIVVDDGSRDATRATAAAAGAHILSHATNRGKGAALRTGMEYALKAGYEVAVTVDADGQHPPAEARRLLDTGTDPDALVLGVRDLVAADAPTKNQRGNRISNFFLSFFAGRPLRDTQCGLRRYPLALTLGLGGRDDRYAFEAEIVLRALAAGVKLVEVPIAVLYPRDRFTHFHAVRDPARIVARVVATLLATRFSRDPVRVPSASPVSGPRSASKHGASSSEQVPSVRVVNDGELPSRGP